MISIVQQRLARFLDVGGALLADGSQLAVASYPGCQQRSHFAGFARYGYAKSQHRFVWGVRLVLLTDLRGLPLGYTIVPANEKEYEPLADLLTGRHGAWCIGCCWSLMASLFALGVMSVVWMAVVAGPIAFEKLIPSRRTATYGTAAMLLVLGVLLVAAPHTNPALTIPGSGSMSPMNQMSP